MSLSSHNRADISAQSKTSDQGSRGPGPMLPPDAQLSVEEKARIQAEEAARKKREQEQERQGMHAPPQNITALGALITGATMAVAASGSVISGGINSVRGASNIVSRDARRTRVQAAAVKNSFVEHNKLQQKAASFSERVEAFTAKHKDTISIVNKVLATPRFQGLPKEQAVTRAFNLVAAQDGAITEQSIVSYDDELFKLANEAKAVSVQMERLRHSMGSASSALGEEHRAQMVNNVSQIADTFVSDLEAIEKLPSRKDPSGKERQELLDKVKQAIKDMVEAIKAMIQQVISVLSGKP